MKIEEAEKLRYTLQMRAKMNEIEFDFKNFRNENGEVDYANAYRAYLAQDNWSYKPNIENQTRIEANKAHRLDGKNDGSNKIWLGRITIQKTKS